MSILDDAKIMADQAEESGSKRCVEGEPMFYLPWGEAVMPGHIYSQLGIRESHLSGWCEFHFDKFFADPQEDGQ